MIELVAYVVLLALLFFLPWKLTIFLYKKLFVEPEAKEAEKEAIRSFDAWAKNHSFSEEKVEILFDEKKSPANGMIPSFVPKGGEMLDFGPRIYDLKQCTSLSLPLFTKSIVCVTDFYDPSKIVLHMPHSQKGKLEIEIPLPRGPLISVRLIIWAVQ